MTLRTWLIGLGVAVACLVASWALLLVLARRLPPGLLRDLAAFIPDCVTTVRRLRRHPQVPRRARIAIVIAGIWVASPIDLIPEFIPVIGPLDDIVVAVLAMRYVRMRMGVDGLRIRWVGSKDGFALLLRVIGSGGRGGPRPAIDP